MEMTLESYLIPEKLKQLMDRIVISEPTVVITEYRALEVVEKELVLIEL